MKRGYRKEFEETGLAKLFPSVYYIRPFDPLYSSMTACSPSNLYLELHFLMNTPCSCYLNLKYIHMLLSY